MLDCIGSTCDGPSVEPCAIYTPLASILLQHDWTLRQPFALTSLRETCFLLKSCLLFRCRSAPACSLS